MNKPHMSKHMWPKHLCLCNRRILTIYFSIQSHMQTQIRMHINTLTHIAIILIAELSLSYLCVKFSVCKMCLFVHFSLCAFFCVRKFPFVHFSVCEHFSLRLFRVRTFIFAHLSVCALFFVCIFLSAQFSLCAFFCLRIFLCVLISVCAFFCVC